MTASPWSESPPRAATVRANLLALGVSEGVARAAQLLALGILARVLGQEGMGIVGTAWAVYQLAVPFVQYAPELIGTREVAQGMDASRAFAEVTRVKLLIALLASALIAAGALIFLWSERDAIVQVLAQIPVLLVAAVSGVWVFRGQRRLWAYAAVRIAASVSLLGALALMLQVVQAPWTVPAAEAITGLIAAAIALVLLLGRDAAIAIRPSLATPRAVIRQHLIEAVQFGIGTFFAAAMWSLPMLVSRPFLDPGEQGLLAASLRLIMAVSALFQLALQVFHPVLAHRYATDREAAKGLAAALAVQVFAVTVPVAAAIALLAPWIVVPMLGSEFEEAAVVLAALAPALIPTTVSSVFGYALLVDGRYRTYVVICAGGALASAAGSGIAFYLWPDPWAAAVLAPVIALVGVVQVIAVWRLNLVSFSQMTWRQLMPARIWQMLKER